MACAPLATSEPLATGRHNSPYRKSSRRREQIGSAIAAGSAVPLQGRRSDHLDEAGDATAQAGVGREQGA